MKKRDLYYERIPTKHLRENVRYLGNILGKVIKQQEGENFFQLVEKVRKLSKANKTSINTNQTNRKVWELIKESVPLEISFGDAAISQKHCNFFINTNNASFDDMNKLIEFVKQKVKEKTGINLEKEIKILK